MTGMLEIINRALELHQSGEILRAIELYSVVVEEDPENAQVLYFLGTAYFQAGNIGKGYDLLIKSLEINPNNPFVSNNLGNIYLAWKRYDEAITSYRRVVRLEPNFIEAYYNLGFALQQQKKFDESIENYNKAIQLKPGFLEAYINRGVALKELGRLDEAIESYNQFIQLNPNNAEVYKNLGNVFKELNMLGEALESYTKAIELRPSYSELYNSRGVVLKELARFNDAINNYDLAIELNPDYAEAYYNRGIVLRDLKKLEDAVKSYNKAIELRPDFPQFYNNLGIVLQELRKLEDAIGNFNKAIQLNPNFEQAYYNRGAALQELKILDQAIESYNKAIDLNPNYVEAYYNRGTAFQEKRNLLEAIKNYNNVIKLKPNFDFFESVRINALMDVCDWSDFNKSQENLKNKILDGNKSASPFTILNLFNSAEIQRAVAELYSSALFPSRESPRCYLKADSKKIRIGYYSSDFYNHATMHLIADLFEKHNREDFEVFAISFGPETGDEWRERAKLAFDKFIDCRAMSDIDISKLSRAMDIDIAIDLKGFTGNSRQGIFSYRSAPIQVNFLGYPGTMGADYIDYIIADKVVIPDNHHVHYSEKIAYLSCCYQPNCADRKISNQYISRQDFGLPDKCIVFCSFNNQWKITPDIFSSWMRILKSVNGSVLWMMATNEDAKINLRKAALLHGIGSDRLIFADLINIEEHLSRLRLADLMLDTFPCSAHTTASDALRMGLPILTQIGDTFASRVSASLLQHVNLAELVAHSSKKYEELAISLGTNSEELIRLKRKLRENVGSSTLYNSENFSRNIETLYKQMVHIYRSGRDPENLYANHRR
jgi:protein O-GlcNAc transferase